MAGWYIMPAHNLAHLQPTLTLGTEDSSYPRSLSRTLDVNLRARLTPNVSLGLQLDWDRGSTDGFAVNAVLVMNNNMIAGGGISWRILSDDNSGFSSATTQVNESTFATDMFELFSSATQERYIRFYYVQITGSYDIGLVSVGEAFQVAPVGPQLAGESRVSDGRFVQVFRPVTRANADTIVERAERMYIHNEAQTVIDAFGGWKGKRPIAVIDDNDGVIYYGPATVSKRGIGKAANYAEIIVSMDVQRETVFG